MLLPIDTHEISILATEKGPNKKLDFLEILEILMINLEIWYFYDYSFMIETGAIDERE